MGCREASFLLSQAQDRELALGEKISLRIHLLMCTKCTNFSRQLQMMRKLNRSYTAQGAQSEDQDPKDQA
ncbi:zf-HC2 domain-containing protein [Chitinibacter bivalviorum]|uniref:Zf-HC2 domain-containing protein n=1 Tax=Chitinibacter bivalviorum TaxID=2739434 RepID=A0A7H9BMC7_9NEIS|nr:zf-HC2 domain-containing protein [Chitinibacter bivalviorum]QLG89251.1 zf-HC2 domain-containing protein [Chitinibacter bivalviorum]